MNTVAHKNGSLIFMITVSVAEMNSLVHCLATKEFYSHTACALQIVERCRVCRHTIWQKWKTTKLKGKITKFSVNLCIGQAASFLWFSFICCFVVFFGSFCSIILMTNKKLCNKIVIQLKVSYPRCV